MSNVQLVRARADCCDPANSRGFSLVELLVALAVLASLLAIAVPKYGEYRTAARNAVAMGDIRNIAIALEAYYLKYQDFPTTLSQISNIVTVDPWGNPYQYLKIKGVKGVTGKTRKDKFLVPLNSDFDLYSKGPDGASASPLTAKQSWDDIVRANDGRFIGLASNY